MKKLFIAIFFLLIWTEISNCQEVDTLYYTLLFKEATPKKYTFYRVVRHDSDIIKVFDYWKNGEIYMSGGYKSDNFKEKTGPFKYYLNNRITRIMLYEPSKYPEFLSSFSGLLELIPQQPDSLYLVIYLFKNNKFHSAGYRSECCLRYGPWIFLSKNGKEAALETYKNNILHGPLEEYYLNQLWLKGSYKNGERDGEWLYYDTRNHSLYKTIIYSSGKKLKVIRS